MIGRPALLGKLKLLIKRLSRKPLVDELEFRYKHLDTQLQDIKHAQATLEDIIRKINTESRRIFVESFNAIRGHFQELYRQLFGGGEGDVIMEDEGDPLECGIEIVARPPGKELRSISLLSGGEKTMTAVALLLTIFKSRPTRSVFLTKSMQHSTKQISADFPACLPCSRIKHNSSSSRTANAR